jgi:hypothetical protein
VDVFLTGAFATHRPDKSFSKLHTSFFHRKLREFRISKPVLDKNFCTSDVYAAY